MEYHCNAYQVATATEQMGILGGELRGDGKVPLPPLLSVFGSRFANAVSQSSESFSSLEYCPGAFPKLTRPHCGKVTKKRNEKGRSPNVNIAFQKLRTLIPTEPVDRRLSKVETLRLAASYIQHLDQTLNCDVTEEQPCLAGSDVEKAGNSICTFCMTRNRKKHLA